MRCYLGVHARFCCEEHTRAFARVKGSLAKVQYSTQGYKHIEKIIDEIIERVPKNSTSGKKN